MSQQKPTKTMHRRTSSASASVDRYACMVCVVIYACQSCMLSCQKKKKKLHALQRSRDTTCSLIIEPIITLISKLKPTHGWRLHPANNFTFCRILLLPFYLSIFTTTVSWKAEKLKRRKKKVDYYSWSCMASITLPSLSAGCFSVRGLYI